MGALIRAFDWASTPLGPIQGWSEILKGAVSLMLPAEAQIVLFWGPDFVALYNDAYAPSIGQKHPQALGRPAQQSWTELWDDLEPLLQRARSGETVFAKDRRFQINRQGFLEDVYFDISYSPARNATGAVEGVVCIVAETTDRVRARQAMAESEARWRELADHISQFAWTADAAGWIYWYNKRWYDYTGTTPEDMAGWGWRKVHHPDHVERVIEKITECFRTGVPWEDTFPLRSRDGQYRWFLSRAMPIRDGAGQVVRWFGTNTDITGQIEAEGQLRQSETRFRTLAQAMPNHVWTAAPDGRLDWVNDRVLEASGLSMASLTRGDWGTLVHPDDRPVAARRWGAALKAGDTYQAELRLRDRHGRYRWYLTRAVPVRDPVAGIVQWIGTNTDIDEQKATAQALTQLNQTLEQQVAERTRERDSAWRNSQDLLAVFDSEGLFRTVNPAWRALLGWDDTTLAGRRYIDFVHPEDEAATAKAMAAALQHALSYFENRLRHRDGRYRRIGWLAAPERGLIYATGRDVTVEREQAEALERSEARLRSVFESSYQYQAFLSPDGLLLDANPTSLAGINAQLADVAGLPFWETPWFSATPGMQDLIRAAIPRVAAGESMRQELVLTLPTGERAFDFSMRPVRDRTGAVIAIVPEALEVTERKHAEEQLRQAQKMEALGQLTGGIAHDFNNMLTGIIGGLDLIRRRIEAGRSDGLPRYIETATASAQRAAALTQRLLAFGRRQALDTRPQDVNGLIGGMADMLRRTLGETIAVTTELDADAWHVLTDGNQFENAVLNLAINARDAMPEGGRLSIATGNVQVDPFVAFHDDLEAGDYVLVTVTDTGTGMPQDVIERAIDPFFTTKPIGQGTGLGLSMVYGFIKQTGGHMRLSSAPGHGTTISLYLRRARPEAGEQTEAAEVEAPRGRGELVLVVEDDPSVRLLITEVLDELGYRHVEAADGQAAIRRLETLGHIDLLVTDVGLPNLNGRQLAEIARQSRPRLKVLFITGYAEHAGMRAGVLPDGMEIMAKPFDLETLGSRIRSLIEG